MGLTANSTGKKLLGGNLKNNKQVCDYTIAIAGNPNVRKINYF